MYVKCKLGCVSLFPEDRFNFPPPDGEGLAYPMGIELEDGTFGGGKGVSGDGSEANESDGDKSDLPF